MLILKSSTLKSKEKVNTRFEKVLKWIEKDAVWKEWFVFTKEFFCFEYENAVVLKINSAITQKLLILNPKEQMSTKDTSYFFLKSLTKTVIIN